MERGISGIIKGYEIGHFRNLLSVLTPHLRNLMMLYQVFSNFQIGINGGF